MAKIPESCAPVNARTLLKAAMLEAEGDSPADHRATVHGAARSHCLPCCWPPLTTDDGKECQDGCVEKVNAVAAGREPATASVAMGFGNGTC